MFRVRNSRRNADTDWQRYSRLKTTIDAVMQEAVAELHGLQTRYQSASERAAFGQQAAENRSDRQVRGVKVDELTETLMHYSQRVSLLKKQIEFLGKLGEDISALKEPSEAGFEPPTNR